MLNQSTRSQSRQEKYSALKKQGIKKTIDTLYPKEVEKLQKEGYGIIILRPHEVVKRFYYCEVTFPEDEQKDA